MTLSVLWVAIVTNPERTFSATRSGSTPEIALALATEDCERKVALRLGRIDTVDLSGLLPEIKRRRL